MKNRIKRFVYFIFLTFLSGISSVCFGLNSNIINYIKSPRGLILSIDSSIFFDSGKDELKESSKEILDEIADIIKIINKPCLVEGNSTNSDIESIFYNSDWEISIVRAERIVEYLIHKKQVDPQKIKALGFGEFMPRGQQKPDCAEQRMDFVIVNYDENDIKILTTE